MKNDKTKIRGIFHDDTFRELIEHSSDGITLISKFGKLLYVSPSARRIFGYDDSEWRMSNPFNYIHPQDKWRVTKSYITLLKRANHVTKIQFRVRHANGSYRWINATSSNLLAHPTIGAIVTNFRDITDEKEAFERLEKNQERLAFFEKVGSILASSIDYKKTLRNIGKIIIPYLADYTRIVVIDEKKEIREIATFHTDPTKLPLVKKMYSSYKGKYTHGVGKLLENGKTELISEMTPEVFSLIKDNKQLRTIMRALGLRSYMGVPMKIRGKVVGAITFSSVRKGRHYTVEDLAIAEELGRRAAFAVENSLLYDNARKAISLRDDFISIASHELKTPVTSLKMYTQYLQSQLEKSKSHQFLRPLVKMDHQIDKLTVLIQDLLNVSKMQIGKLEFTMEEFDLQEVIEEGIENIKPVANNHNIEYTGVITKKIVGDKERIGQVITNLLGNAVKYSPLADKVSIRVSEQKNKVLVMIEDYGIGIGKEHQAKIFNRFYRVTGAEQRTFPGLGIGLYISSQIIKRHGGEMHVVSKKGMGSRFSFIIPAIQK